MALFVPNGPIRSGDQRLSWSTSRWPLLGSPGVASIADPPRTVPVGSAASPGRRRAPPQEAATAHDRGCRRTSPGSRGGPFRGFSTGDAMCGPPSWKGQQRHRVARLLGQPGRPQPGRRPDGLGRLCDLRGPGAAFRGPELRYCSSRSLPVSCASRAATSWSPPRQGPRGRSFPRQLPERRARRRRPTGATPFRRTDAGPPREQPFALGGYGPAPRLENGFPGLPSTTRRGLTRWSTTCQPGPLAHRHRDGPAQYQQRP